MYQEADDAIQWSLVSAGALVANPRLSRAAEETGGVTEDLAGVLPPSAAAGGAPVPSPDNIDPLTPDGVVPGESSSKVPLGSTELTEEASKRMLQEEEERRKARRRGKGRIRELEEIRAELAEKELVLLEKQQELLEQEQTVLVLREELELERKLRALLTKEKEKAEEEAALAMGLCTGGSMLP